MRASRAKYLCLWLSLFTLQRLEASHLDSGDSGALRGHALSHEGDPLRGREVFRTLEPISCLSCHRVLGEGGDAGPDLSDVGNKFERPHLIESLLEPSRQIVEGFRPTVMALEDGRVVSGIVRDETDDSLRLIGADAASTTIRKSEIADRKLSDVSLMPENLVAGLDPQSFTDLVAYVATLRPARPPTPGEIVADVFSLPAGFRARRVADGLSAATALEITRDGRILICEQEGTLRLVADDRLRAEPLVRLEVDSTWERGLIGVTVDPGFPERPFIYVCYVSPRPAPHHVISRLTMENGSIDPSSERILLEGDDQTRLGGSVPAGHQGGALHFGRDGMLYAAIGEQTAGAPAQDLNSLLGKLLRIRPDGAIPGDNPFTAAATGKYRSIWALGLRNPYTFAVQPESGRIFANDVGQNAWEEINEIERGGNYGWPACEGLTSDARFVAPIHVYPAASISGGAFAPADLAWPDAFRGRYFFMDFVRGWIKTLDPDNPAKPPATFATGLARPVDLRFSPDGSLYVLVRDAWVIDNEYRRGTGSLLKIVSDSAALGGP
jgi:putative heme-binding domain-containing protein